MEIHQKDIMDLICDLNEFRKKWVISIKPVSYAHHSKYNKLMELFPKLVLEELFIKHTIIEFDTFIEYNNTTTVLDDLDIEYQG